MTMSASSAGAVVTVLVFLTACGPTARNQPEPLPASRGNLDKGLNLQRIYLDEMPATIAGAANQKTVLSVTGNLPSPAYRLDHVEVKVAGKVIEITPLAQYDPAAIVVQMIVPFQETVEIAALPPGKYRVRFLGRSGVQESNLEVSK